MHKIQIFFYGRLPTTFFNLLIAMKHRWAAGYPGIAPCQVTIRLALPSNSTGTVQVEDTNTDNPDLVQCSIWRFAIACCLWLFYSSQTIFQIWAGDMMNSTRTSSSKTWMGFTREQAAASLATIWGTGWKATENRQLTNQRTSCSASSRCPTTLLSRRSSWSTLGHRSSQNLEELSVFSLAYLSCRCGMGSIWSERGFPDICQKRTQTRKNETQVSNKIAVIWSQIRGEVSKKAKIAVWLISTVWIGYKRCARPMWKISALLQFLPSKCHITL